jgi:very-short-patch-repair endonuclease
VRTAQHQVTEILTANGVIGRREHPELARALDGMCRRGELAAVLPGWYALNELRAEPKILVTAIQRADPDSVIAGRAAAQLSFWPGLGVREVDVAVMRRRAPRPGYRFVTRPVAPEHVIRVGGLRLTSPALTALDLVPELGGDALDQVLRTRAAGLPTLRCVLDQTSNRRGNATRTRALVESRDGAWSGGERRLHAILHDAGIEGWVTNCEVEVAEGVFFLDLAFWRARLAVEMDGWTYHGRYYADFVAFLRRHTALEASGWRVLHLSADDLDRPDWVAAKIRQALGIS